MGLDNINKQNKVLWVNIQSNRIAMYSFFKKINIFVGKYEILYINGLQIPYMKIVAQ